jgi:hypothetical protein
MRASDGEEVFVLSFDHRSIALAGKVEYDWCESALRLVVERRGTDGLRVYHGFRRLVAGHETFTSKRILYGEQRGTLHHLLYIDESAQRAVAVSADVDELARQCLRWFEITPTSPDEYEEHAEESVPERALR